MIDLLPLAAAAAETGAEPHGLIEQFKKLAEHFALDPGFIIPQMVNFALVALVLWQFAFKPVIKTIDRRQARIKAGLDYAEEMERKLREAEQERAETIKRADLEAERIVQQARATAEALQEKLSTEASAQAEAILRKAEKTIEQERKTMLAEVRKEIAGLVVATAERVLQKKMTKADRTAYNESAQKELTSVR